MERKQMAYAVCNLNTLGLLYMPTVLQMWGFDIGVSKKVFSNNLNRFGDKD